MNSANTTPRCSANSGPIAAIDERPIAVFNVNGEFLGLLNRCPHQGAALCEGPLIGLAQSSDPGEIEYTRLGEIIRCPWHGGNSTSAPASPTATPSGFARRRIRSMLSLARRW
jgi:nitrite reductase/ring-hydroxylating ferredoxin subunit